MDRLRVAFMGSPDLGVPCLEALAGAPDMELAQVVTLGARRRDRRGAARPTPVGEAARRLDLPLLEWERGQAKDVTRALAALKLDLLVVIAFARILRPALLEIPRLGCLNLHASLLPWGRGASPIQQAILEGLPTTGWTAMLMDAGLDTGPILAREELTIAPRWTAGELYAALKERAPGFLLRSVGDWVAGRLQPTAQDESAASYAPKIDPGAGALDWREPAALLDRRLRAFQPWPGCWFHRRGLRLRVLEALPEHHSPEGPPGRLLEAGPRLRVACGAGSLDILRLQAPGGRPLAAVDFLNGHPMQVGEVLEGG